MLSIHVLGEKKNQKNVEEKNNAREKYKSGKSGNLGQSVLGLERPQHPYRSTRRNNYC